MKLFRSEVQDAQAAQWLGRVRLHRPLSFSVLTLSALALGSLLVSFAAWGDVNRKAKLSGVLAPTAGSLNIAAPQAGVVQALPVLEGQVVQAGDVILVINTEHGSVHGGAVGLSSERAAALIDARTQSLRSEQNLRQLQSTQRDQVLADRARTLQAELRQAGEERALQQRRVQLAQTTLERHEKLAQEGFVAQAQVQTRQEELLDAKARLQAAERQLLALQRDLSATLGERQALSAQLRTDLAQVQRNLSSLEQEASENASRKTVVVTAPHAGVLTGLGVKAGQSVTAGQLVGTVVPPTDAPGAKLVAQLFAPSRTVGFVRAGQTVFLRYDAFPYQKFGLYAGRVLNVSETPFAPSELPPNLAQQLIARAGSNEALYRINVELSDQRVQAYGEDVSLKPGLTVEADVLQERRKVWEWVLEPVLAARQQVKVLNADPAKARASG